MVFFLLSARSFSPRDLPQVTIEQIPFFLWLESRRPLQRKEGTLCNIHTNSPLNAMRIGILKKEKSQQALSGHGYNTVHGHLHHGDPFVSKIYSCCVLGPSFSHFHSLSHTECCKKKTRSFSSRWKNQKRYDTEKAMSKKTRKKKGPKKDDKASTSTPTFGSILNFLVPVNEENSGASEQKYN